MRDTPIAVKVGRREKERELIIPTKAMLFSLSTVTGVPHDSFYKALRERLASDLHLYKSPTCAKLHDIVSGY